LTSEGGILAQARSCSHTVPWEARERLVGRKTGFLFQYLSDAKDI